MVSSIYPDTDIVTGVTLEGNFCFRGGKCFELLGSIWKRQELIDMIKHHFWLSGGSLRSI
jgi:hypothetical protein